MCEEYDKRAEYDWCVSENFVFLPAKYNICYTEYVQ